MPRIAYVNGRFRRHADAAVHIEDRGFQFADGVYEVVAIKSGVHLDEDGHFKRLRRSLSELDMPWPVSERVLRHLTREVARRNGVRDGLVYVQVTRGTAPRDFKYPAEAPPTLVITARRADLDPVA